MKSLGWVAVALVGIGCAAGARENPPPKVAFVPEAPAAAPEASEKPATCVLRASLLDSSLRLRSPAWPGHEIGRLWQGNAEVELRLDGGLIPVRAEGFGRVVRAWARPDDLVLQSTDPKKAAHSGGESLMRFRAAIDGGRVRVVALKRAYADQLVEVLPEEDVDCSSLRIYEPVPTGRPPEPALPEEPTEPAIRCPHVVTLYVTAYPWGVEDYTAPIPVAELAAGTPFNAQKEVGPSGKPREPMRYLEDNTVMQPVFFNALDLGVTEQALVGCENVPPLDFHD